MHKRKESSNKHDPRARSETPLPSAIHLGVLAGISLIIVAVFIAYLPSINGGFIWDDDRLLTDNPLIKASNGLYRIWCTTEVIDYWPVTNTTLWIEWRLWEMNPAGYRVTNLVLHVAASLLIWIILRKLSIPGAFLAAMIFAVHPVNVESVAWISQRKSLTAMLFFLLSILCYLKYEAKAPGTSAGAKRVNTTLKSIVFLYCLSLAAFVLAMLSKGSVAILPILLLGIIWWLRPPTLWDLVRLLPFFLVAMVLAAVNVWFQTHGADVAFRSASFTERLLGAGGAVWFYLYKALVPLNLSYVYPQWHIQTNNLLWWLPLLSLLAVTAVLWLYREKWSRSPLFALGFFCVSLAPVMGFIDIQFMHCSLVADHYQHIAVIGVIALASAGWSAWRQRLRGEAHWAAIAVAITAVGALACLTWQQSGLYRDPILLYQATLKKNPDAHIVHNSLGLALDNAGRLQEAIKHFEQAVALKPDYLEAQNHLGFALAKVGRLQEAIEHFQQALKLKSDLVDAHYNLGLALLQTARPQEAIAHFEQALAIKPNYPEAHNNLGVALGKLGRLQEAIEHYQQALRLEPDYSEAHNNLGIALIQADRTQEAIEHFKQALRIVPDNINTLANLALAHASMHQSTEALAAAEKAVELARSKGLSEQARQIDDWMNSYRASLSDHSNASHPSKITSPTP